MRKALSYKKNNYLLKEKTTAVGQKSPMGEKGKELGIRNEVYS
jgi:hypothetical protein